ncbi:hypothetical protein FA13DRAFT_225976 [Coprinellus micaceus]|uniref:Uncharacterized protein n=1 Tax=Coprinellus micaceus TaxID=71717 RepID=A0A4Y7TGZ4_COPMI|nr:hypothetical protein FA13DRAFT_225976 [Coprinellus micaceus]
MRGLELGWVGGTNWGCWCGGEGAAEGEGEGEGDEEGAEDEEESEDGGGVSQRRESRWKG